MSASSIVEEVLGARFDSEYQRIGSDPAITPDMVAGYIADHPHYGRDQQLAQGWLVALAAADAGEDVRAALGEFVSKSFVVGNNNGVPLKAAEYPPTRVRR